MPNTEIIRAYQLQPGDRFIMIGREYRVHSKDEKFIWYVLDINGVWHNKNSMGAKSQELIQRVTNLQTINKNENGNQNQFSRIGRSCVNFPFDGFNFRSAYEGTGS